MKVDYDRDVKKCQEVITTLFLSMDVDLKNSNLTSKQCAILSSFLLEKKIPVSVRGHI